MARDGRIRHQLPPPRWPTRAEAGAALLFQPIAVGPLTLHRRTWVPAMVPWRATAEGEVTEAVLAWYARFAESQPGAIVVEATGIRDVPSGPLLRIGHDRYIPGLQRLTERVAEASKGKTKLLIQIIDFLAIRRRVSQEKFVRRFLVVTPELRGRLVDEGIMPGALAASEVEVRSALVAADEAVLARVLEARVLEDLRMGYRERVGDMHLPQIRELPETLPPLFADAAVRAQAAGFDGVELHFAHGYTMASFLSRLNDRNDGYGGSPRGRVRLPLEVHAAVRSRLSKQVALGCRFLGDEVISGGSRIEDACFYATAFAEAGMDFLSVSKGGKFEDAKQPKVNEASYPYTGPSGHECMPTIYSDVRGPLGRNLPLSRAIRKAVREHGHETPVVGAGGINTFDIAEGALRSGDCDIVGSARQSLADPDWFEKVRLGRGEEVRSCALTNYCEGLDQRHKQVTCRLWDRRFDAEDASILRSHDGKRRLVAPPWSRD